MEKANGKLTHLPTRSGGGDGVVDDDFNHYGYDDHRREYYHISADGERTIERDGRQDGRRRQKEREESSGALKRKKKKKKKIAPSDEDNGETERELSDEEKERYSKVTPSPRSSSASRVVDSATKRGHDDKDRTWDEEKDGGDDNVDVGVDKTPSGRRGRRLLFPPSNRRRRNSPLRSQHGSKGNRETKKRVLARSFSDSLLKSFTATGSSAAGSVLPANTSDAHSQAYTEVAKNNEGSTKYSISSRTKQCFRQRRRHGEMDSLALMLPPQRKTQQQSSLSRVNRPDESGRSSPRPVPSTGRRGPGRPRINYLDDQRYTDVPRRGPGRPRKYPIVANKCVETPDKDPLEFSSRRGRGRPRKNQQQNVDQAERYIGIGVDSRTDANGIYDRPPVNCSILKNQDSSDILSDLLPLFNPPETTARVKPRSAEQILEDVRMQEDKNRRKLAMERRQRRFTLIRSAARRRGSKRGVYVGSQHLDHDHEEDDASSRGGTSTISRPWLERTCKTRKRINYNEESDGDDNSKSSDEDDGIDGMEEESGRNENSPTLSNSDSHKPRYHDGMLPDDHDIPASVPSNKRRARSPTTRLAFERIANPFATSSQQSSTKREILSKSKMINDNHARLSSSSLKNACHGSQEKGTVRNHDSEQHCEDSVVIESTRDAMVDLHFHRQHPVERGSDVRYKDDGGAARSRPDLTFKERGSLRNRSKDQRFHDQHVGDHHYPDDGSNSPLPKSSNNRPRDPLPLGSSSRRESNNRRREDKGTSSSSRSPSRKKRVRFEITKPDGTRIKFRCDAGVDSSSNAAVQTAIAVLTGASQTNIDFQDSSNMTQKSEEQSQNKDDMNDIDHRRGIDASVSGSRHFNAKNQEFEENGNGETFIQSHRTLSLGNNGDSCSVTSELTHHWNADVRTRKRKLRDKFALLEDDDRDIRHVVNNSNNNFVDSGDNGPAKHSSGDTLSQRRSRTRHGRRWSCIDSLAGSHADFSKRHSEAETTTRKSYRHLPQHVAVPSKTKNIHSSKRHQHKKLHVSKNELSHINPTRDASLTNSTLPVSQRGTKISLTTRSSSYRCGRCLGCSLVIDCQTCESCLRQLHHQRFGPEHSGCLQRRCHRARRFTKFDSLMSVASNTSRRNSNHDCVDNLSKKAASDYGSQEQRDDSRWEPNDNGNSGEETGEGARSKLQSDSRTTNTAFEENDDWSVDYSYLSEPEHQSKWRKQQQLQRRRFSSSHSVSSLSRLGGRAKGTVASLSTISASARPMFHSPAVNPDRAIGSFYGGQPQKGGPGRPRGPAGTKKQLKNPLHDLAFPLGGSASVTSWPESRECLRALMEYDEEDQEWM